MSHQPDPTPGEGDVWAEVIADGERKGSIPPRVLDLMRERRQVGIDRYGSGWGSVVPGTAPIAVTSARYTQGSVDGLFAVAGTQDLSDPREQVVKLIQLALVAGGEDLQPF